MLPHDPRTPVVCLPGLQGLGAVFEPLEEALGREFSILAIDLPPGDPDHEALRLDQHLATQVSERFHLVTGSYGGLVALRMDLSRARTLTLIGTSPCPKLIARAFGVKAALARVLPASLQGILYRQHLSRSLAQDGVPAPLAARVVSQAPSAEILNARLANARLPRRQPPAELPLLWVSGAQDPHTPWPAAYIKEFWPQAQCQKVNGAHRPYASHAADLAPVLKAFWADAEQESATGSRKQ